MFESVFSTATEGATNLGDAVISLTFAIIMGVVISVAYMIVSRKEGYNRDFIMGLVLLPAIVSMVILLIGSSVARAFSMAGAFALVRFRSAPGSAKDIAIVFLTMASGLACGLGLIFYAVVAVVIIIVVMVLLYYLGFGTYKPCQKQLKIIIPENLNYSGVFDEAFGKYCEKTQLRNIKTANMGTLYELTYWVDLKPGIDEKAFIDELRIRNGNLNIALGMIPERIQAGMLN